MRINEVRGLVNRALIDWQGTLIDANCNRYGRSISWTRQPRFVEEPVLSTHVLQLIEDRQFTHQVTEQDEVVGIIQIHYTFDRTERNVDSATLAYFGTMPTSTDSGMGDGDQIDNKSSANNQLKNADNVSVYSVPWIRVDFAPKSMNGITHHACHMHLGGFPNTRIAVRGLPNPRQFVEMVMALFHPHIYRQHREASQSERQDLHADLRPLEMVNENCIIVTDYPIVHHIAHLCFPTVSQ